MFGAILKFRSKNERNSQFRNNVLSSWNSSCVCNLVQWTLFFFRPFPGPVSIASVFVIWMVGYFATHIFTISYREYSWMSLHSNDSLHIFSYILNLCAHFVDHHLCHLLRFPNTQMHRHNLGLCPTFSNSLTLLVFACTVFFSLRWLE